MDFWNIIRVFDDNKITYTGRFKTYCFTDHILKNNFLAFRDAKTNNRLAPGRFQRLAGRLGGQVGDRLVGGRAMAAADTGALDDPLVGGVDDLGQVVIGDDLVGEISPDPGHDTTQNLGHSGGSIHGRRLLVGHRGGEPRHIPFDLGCEVASRKLGRHSYR